MKAASLLLLSFVLFLSTLASVAQEERYYKGNLHTHSYWSDGDEFPEMIMQWYKNKGYDFVALSDHNTIAEGEKWKTIPKDSLYQDAFRQYLEKYGEDWVKYRQDSTGTHVKLKALSEFRTLFEEEEKFLIFRAEEVTSYLEGKAVHIGAINVQEYIEPREGSTIVELIQNNIDAIREQSERTGEPILQHLNHPNFTYAITAEDIIQIDGERFFEVFNGHPYVNNYGDSIHDSTEKIWDQVNIAYLNTGKPIMYGLATDDSHHYHKFGSKYSNAGRGWVMVKSDKLHPHSLMEAMESGDFYSTTGVELESVTFENNILSVKIKAEEGVTYTTEFITAHEDDSQTETVKTIEGTEAAFRLPKDHLFVRAKITSSKLKENPYKEGDVEVAWTQPFLPEN
ncbi:histidinol-phosphatase [Antarcticibacterium flavum]|uniref:Histidinol-phosphatase n=1 Tax=Antarcticibacterium flavum TaxID=2058175 RepID=A0A5B7X2J9_9FLAO|nr:MULTISPECIES: histidinol-phosphatase [Antarcticibacterium]MCM4159867.1 histidinol-phosphatase [Antarcticibacterium sp. W02-3]QCY68868.1 histidinol-phosphatase [Antarcticibacterium flavum]